MPAIAIADLIKRKSKDAEILFVGATGGMEEELVARAGYEIRTIRVMGLSRRLTLANVKAAYFALSSVWEAKAILEKFAPDIVIGTGGYASYPALRAAVSLGIPCAVHESNAVPGLVVKRLAARVDRVWLNFEEAARPLDKRASVLAVGNPLPQGYAVPEPVSLPRGTRQMVLSFGGSLGANALNDAVLDMMELERARGDIYHLHATGKREYERVRAAFCARRLERALHLTLVPFITPMANYMVAADVVICRAGAMSLGELAALGKCAILVPSPNVTGNHQLKNASALADRKAAVLIEEADLTGQHLWQQTEQLLADPSKRRGMERAVRAFHHPRTCEEIWEDICLLCEKKGAKRY